MDYSLLVAVEQKQKAQHSSESENNDDGTLNPELSSLPSEDGVVDTQGSAIVHDERYVHPCIFMYILDADIIG
jgi:hypothetical protein